MIERGRICLAEIAGATHRRPVLVVQSDPFNQSLMPSVVVVPLTEDLRWADAPGNVLLPSGKTGLHRDTVAEAAQPRALERLRLTETTALLDPGLMQRVDGGLRLVLGL